jgi:hypothetical protein
LQFTTSLYREKVEYMIVCRIRKRILLNIELKQRALGHSNNKE